MSGDLYEDYATLVADTLALLQSYHQSGGRLLPVGPVPGLPSEERDAPTARPAVVSARPETRPPEAPAQRPPVLRPQEVRAPATPSSDARQVRPPEVEPPRPASAWARYTRDSGEQLGRHQAEVVGECRRCGRCESRKHLLFGIGSPRADLVVITSSPTEEEEYHQQLLMGPVGEMFDNILSRVLNTSREKVYLLPALMCRGKGKLNPAELDACRPLVEEQVRIIKPRVVLALGAEALALLGPEARRGEWGMFGGVDVMATWHPAEILADPNRKRPAFTHLQMVQPRLGQVSLFGR